MGRDTAIGAGAVGTGAAAHHHHHQEGAQRDNYAPETGRSFPLGGSSNTGTGSNYPSGQSGTYPAGGATTAGSHSSNLANKADPRIDSDLDRSRATGASDYGSDYPSGQSGTYPAGGATTAALHSSNLANKADPRIDSDLDRSRNTGASGYGSGTSATPASRHSGSLGRDAALGAGTGAAAGGMASGMSSHGPDSWRHDHGTHGHQYEGDPCGPGETTAGGPHFVSGPHATDTANRLDPHVSGGVGGPETTAGRHGQHGHRSEEAALAGGATGAGLGAYAANRDHRSTDTGSSTDSGLSNQQGTTNMPGSSIPRASDPYSSHGPSHHRGEGAALGGASLAGATAYEGDKYRRNEPNISNTTSGTRSSAEPYPSSSVDPRVGAGQSSLDNSTTTHSGRDHHLGRDAGLGTGAGGLAYEAERHHGQPTQSTNIPSSTTGSGYDSTRGPSAYDQAGSRMAGSSQQPAATKDHHLGRDAALGAGAGGVAYEAGKHHEKDHSGVASTPQSQLAGSGHQPQTFGSDSNYPQQTGRDHHLGRDTAVGGAALGAGAGAGAAGVDEHKKFRETGRMDPGTSVREHQHSGDPVATYPSSGYGNERNVQDSGHRGHRKEEEALAGGAAAGGLAHHEHSKKDEKALEKEHSKEVKHHEKELAKEEKAHEKDLKAHEKERAKHMAAIEKDQKKHEHDVQKQEHEHDGEKKKGGLLGFLHRDKPDKELKEDEAHRQAALRSGDGETSAGAGAGSYSDPLAGEHGSQSGVHDTPIGRGTTTHDAYGTQEGHNKLHKDPPGNLAGAHGADYQGHGNVS